jgi:hypothetical protein
MRIRVFLVCSIVLLLAIAGVGYYVLTRPHPTTLPVILGPACSVTTPTGKVGLDATQIANAATITATGIRHSMPDQAMVVALAVALQESKLENLPTGDRDSVGLFQQRPSQGWGTADELQDPRVATNKFYTALLKVKGWQTMRVTEAAQRVQRSAYPEAYQQWADEAQILVEALTGSAPSAVACTRTGDPEAVGPAAVAGLGTLLHLDWGDITTVDSPDNTGLSVTVGDPHNGWQYAHWLVAHSVDQGVARVQYENQEWTADSGAWKQVNLSVTSVFAEVYRA